MIKQILDVWPYEESHGVRTEWPAEAIVHIESMPMPHIAANAAGLLALAKLFATLAQVDVPLGTHVHIDDFIGASGAELIVERL